eukprot:1304701-Rhodomonas_salina.1
MSGSDIACGAAAGNEVFRFRRGKGEVGSGKLDGNVTLLMTIGDLVRPNLYRDVTSDRVARLAMYDAVWV